MNSYEDGLDFSVPSSYTVHVHNFVNYSDGNVTGMMHCIIRTK